MIRIRSFSGDYPLPDMDVTTGSNRVAAREAAQRAVYDNWDDVQINFNDGSRPMRGDELHSWVRRHFPAELAE